MKFKFNKQKKILNLILFRYLTAPESFIHDKNRSLIPIDLLSKKA